jgi:glycosyltransferase involved in cell wall biosynthesis
VCDFSVLMSVYGKDDPKQFQIALESVCVKQSVKPAQVVLVIDGPITEQLGSVIDRWVNFLGDSLCIRRLEHNIGLGGALNEGIKYCSFDLVARMDSDDISIENRFQMQLDFMANNPNVVASSGVVEEWDHSMSKLLSKRILPSDCNDLLKFARLRSPLNHPATIFRKSIVESVGGYPPLRKAQDYALWSKLLSEGYSLGNLSIPLVKMRSGVEMLKRRGREYFYSELMLLNYQRNIGFLSRRQYLLSFLVRLFLRLSPNAIKTLAYRQFR